MSKSSITNGGMTSKDDKQFLEKHAPKAHKLSFRMRHIKALNLTFEEIRGASL